MTDPLDDWHRAALAETMRPCPEASREERELGRAVYQESQRLTRTERAEARARRAQLADLFGDTQAIPEVS